jgi:hypothetical protein
MPLNKLSYWLIRGNNESEITSANTAEIRPTFTNC